MVANNQLGTCQPGCERGKQVNIVEGNWIEVSGYIGSDGSVDATMISCETETAHGNRAELNGVVSNLDIDTQYFTFNGIDVDYSAAILPTTLIALANGLSAEVYGTLDIATNSSVATHLELQYSSSDLGPGSHTMMATRFEYGD